MAATLGGVVGGPALGDHEAIIAQSARQMRLSGDWLVPQFLETNFLRKSPLPVWLVTASSFCFGNDPATGQPVTTAAARLPSALLSFGTVLLLWHLASCMFGRRAGLVTAIVSASSAGLLLYAPNATAEMPLTFCCTWAYYHFWFAATADSKARQFGHALAFYLALGFAMLAKGPAPVALVGFPLAVWWFVHRPLRVISRGGPEAWRKSLSLFFRRLIPQTVAAFTRLWFIPGILLFALVFVPWMLAVAQRHPSAWDLWNWQFLQRAKGDYPDTRNRSFFYYIPIVGGLVLPWTFLVIEAAIAPWVRRYADVHRALLFVGLWALLGILSMSLMEFKKPYYILPAVPGLQLLIGVAAVRTFFDGYNNRIERKSWPLRAGIVLQVCGMIGGAAWLWMSGVGQLISVAMLIIAIVMTASFIGAFLAYLRGSRRLAFASTAIMTVLGYQVILHGFASALEDVDVVTKLASTLDSANVPRDARVFWADQRPDARLAFYFGRQSEHMIDAEEILGAGILDRRTGKQALEQMVKNRALELLRSPEPVYLILHQASYDRMNHTPMPNVYTIGNVKVLAEPSPLDLLILTNAPPTSGT